MKVSNDFDRFEYISIFDPGGKTGYARLYIDRARMCVRIIEIGEFLKWGKVKSILDKVDCRNELVVIEDFHVRFVGAECVSLEIIGVIEYVCAERRIYSIRQQPHERINSEKWFPDITKFDNQGKRGGISESHCGSALRHGIYTCVNYIFKRKLMTLEYDFEHLMSNFINP